MALNVSDSNLKGAFISEITVVSPAHPEKAFFPMFVTELGRVIDVRPVQSAKALSLMYHTEPGIVIDVRPVQP